jgi:hypothetical protein
MHFVDDIKKNRNTKWNYKQLHITKSIFYLFIQSTYTNNIQCLLHNVNQL